MIYEGFKYPALLEHFEKISSIPRMSYHEEKIAAYLCEFAKARGLEYYTDGANNVLINLPATEGKESCEPILLQGHTDMVCEKDGDSDHDFDCEGLDLYVDRGFLKARGTTLGADDGIAVAAMLALLDGAIAPHPACQCLFTSSEEVGLDGAKAFDYSRIFARKMINMDAADEIYLIVGCAGGMRSDVFFEIEFAEAKHKTLAAITIDGLMGGHSGENINDGRANANKLAGELLSRILNGCDAELVSINGGNKDNAIPRHAEILLALSDAGETEKIVRAYERETAEGLSCDDSAFAVSFNIVSEGYEGRAFSKEFAHKTADFINSIENGVLAMSENIEGLVEFSRNLGIIRTEGERLGVYFSSRSAIDEQIDMSAARIEGLAASLGGRTEHHSRYPGWNYTGSSALADKYIAKAKELYGEDVSRTVLHAGLECGIVKQAIPDIEIVSCGPDIKNLHAPTEALDLASFERFFGIVKAVIEDC